MDTTYLRNRVRHELIPLVTEGYNRAAKLHLWQLAELARSEDEAMEALVSNLWPQLIAGSAPTGVLSLHTQPILNKPEAIKRRVARRALLEVAGTLEGFELEHIEAVCDLFSAPRNRAGRTDLPNSISVQREAEVVRIWNRDAGDFDTALVDVSTWPLMEPGSVQHLSPTSQVKLVEGWTLTVCVDQPSALLSSDDNLSAQFDLDALADDLSLVIRTRKPSDQIIPFGMRGTKSLQDLFVDAKIPRDVRDRLLLLAFHESSDILWVPGPGGRRSAHAPVTDATERVIQFRFERDPMPKGEV